MAQTRPGADAVKRFLQAQIPHHPEHIVRLTMDHFGLSRQAVLLHLNALIKDGMVAVQGTTRDRRYSLVPAQILEDTYEITVGLTEDQVWQRSLSQHFDGLPENVRSIWHYAFTEMFNNVIDHAEAASASVKLTLSGETIIMTIQDDGVGIFKKISRHLGLSDPRHAALEIAKGKVTTDPDRHSGEGIFFTSRMFDEFTICSDSVCYAHDKVVDRPTVSDLSPAVDGTIVSMALSTTSSTTVQDVFNAYTEDFTFNKTIVPVVMSEFGDDNLVSRSQARRLLTRLHRFSHVVLDFDGVHRIGQSFADEIFRVFANEHPDVRLEPINMGSEVNFMVQRARMHS